MRATKTLDAADEFVELNLPNSKRTDLAVQLAGTFTGTLQLQVSNDGQNWHAVEMQPIGGGAAATDMTAAGFFVPSFQPIGAQKARVYATALSSGSVAVDLTGAQSE